MDFLNLPWMQYQFLGNSVKAYFIALAAFVVLLIVFKIFQLVVLRRLAKLALKTKTDIDDAIIKIVQSVRPPFYMFLAFYFALYFLSFTDRVRQVINALLIIWIIFLVVKAVEILINHIVNKSVGQEKEKSAQAAAKTVGLLAKVVIWCFGLLLLLSNLGVNITSLVAGLGIGGLAIALAAQNILTDLFSSFAIYFDKPFIIGDFIAVGDKKGTVEKIGIKTTRIKSPQGEEIVMSNKELTSAQIQNFGKMKERRIIFSIGVVYETKPEKLKMIPDIIKGIIESVKDTRFDRAHFKQFDDSALTFEIVYYVTSSDYVEFMDMQQDINFKIFDAFAKEKISMAYPTQTLYIEK